MIIGVIGRVGTGKSTLQRVVEAEGLGHTIDLDQVGHLALEDPQVKADLVHAFTDDILDDNGHISRPALATRAFVSDHTINQLNRISHPFIKTTTEDMAHQLHQQGQGHVVIIGAVLIEIGLADLCDRILVIDADDEDIQHHAGERFHRAKFQRSRQAFLEAADDRIKNTYNGEFLEQCKAYFNHVQNT